MKKEVPAWIEEEIKQAKDALKRKNYTGAGVTLDQIRIKAEVRNLDVPEEVYKLRLKAYEIGVKEKINEIDERLKKDPEIAQNLYDNLIAYIEVGKRKVGFEVQEEEKNAIEELGKRIELIKLKQQTDIGDIDFKKDLNAIQPIDNYVRELLKIANEKYGLGINVDNPTRGERLKAALALRNEGNGHYSLEIMVGRMVNSNESIAIDHWLFRQTLEKRPWMYSWEEFYKGFRHLYWPEKNGEEQRK